MRIPERHLGLYMSHEVDRSLLNVLSRLVEKNIDLDALLEATKVEISNAEPESHLRAADGVRVGVAMDEASTRQKESGGYYGTDITKQSKELGITP